MTVVTVSGGRASAGGMTGGAAFVVAGWLVCVVGGLTVADTEPLSPPPRITTVQSTATSRMAPATPATHTQRRSIGAWLPSSYSS